MQCVVQSLLKLAVAVVAALASAAEDYGKSIASAPDDGDEVTCHDRFDNSMDDGEDVYPVALLQSSILHQRRSLAERPPPPYLEARLPGAGANEDYLRILQTLVTNTTICNTLPKYSDMSRPMLEITQGQQVDGPCFFNYWPTCALAHRARDYMVYPIPFGLFYSSMPPTSYKSQELWTLPGVAALDAKLCHDMGWLDVPNPDELLNDFDKMNKQANDTCTSLRQEVPEYKNLTMLDFNKYVNVVGTWSLPEQRISPYANQRTMQLYENIKCNMGTYAVACDIANCLYTFCKLEDGRIGSGRQCRKNWMGKEDTVPHLKPYESFIPGLPEIVRSFGSTTL